MGRVMSRRVIIIGAGGHGQVVADILLQMATQGAALTPVGYVDDDASLTGRQLIGLPVLGRVADLAAIEHDAVTIAIGANRTRRKLLMNLQAQGESLVAAIHPSAVVAPSATIGAGAVLCAGVIVNPGATIGANTIVNTGATVDHHNVIGDHAHIAPGVHLGGDVAIGEGTLIGIGAVVMPQRRVGAWCTVGAGAVVTRDLPDQVVAIGAPARVIRTQK